MTITSDLRVTLADRVGLAATLQGDCIPSR